MFATSWVIRYFFHLATSGVTSCLPFKMLIKMQLKYVISRMLSSSQASRFLYLVHGCLLYWHYIYIVLKLCFANEDLRESYCLFILCEVFCVCTEGEVYISSSEVVRLCVTNISFVKCDNFLSCSGKVCLHLVITILNGVFRFIKNYCNFIY